MTVCRDEQAKQELAFVLKNYIITDATSLFEVKTLFGPFVNLVAENTNRRYTKTCKKAILHAADDLQGMLYAMTLCDEIQRRSPGDDPLMRSLEVRALIQMFFIDVRSMFDYLLVATLILFKTQIAPQSGTFGKILRGQLKRPNFTVFRNAVIEHNDAAISCFGKELVRLWLGANWFVKFNNWRNGIAHEGFFVAVNKENPDLFRVETIHGVYPLHRRFLPSKILGEENSVSFKAFSGLYSGRMLYLANQWCERLRLEAKLSVGQRGYGGRGGTVCMNNIKHVLGLL